MIARKNTHGNYAVGYGKPPVHTRFRKGQSGNPRGRAHESPAGHAKALALEEAYRTITVKEGRDTVTLPAIQAILRRQIALATEGNGPAQRTVIAAVLAIEQEQSAAAAEQSARQRAADSPTDLIDAARRVCFNLSREEEEKLAAGGVRQAGLEASVPNEQDIEPGLPMEPDGG